MHFSCPRCGETLAADEASAGNPTGCPTCGHKFIIPPKPPSTALPSQSPIRASKSGVIGVIVVVVLCVGLLIVTKFPNHRAVPEQQSGIRSDTAPDAEPMAISGIETLPPITVKLNNELLNALRMTDELDALYKRGCSSIEFASEGRTAEAIALELQKKLPKTDPRHDLLVGTFESYQRAALAMARKERGLRTESPNVLISVAQIRKGLLTKILEGNMTPDEKNLHYAWLKAASQ